MSKRLITYVLLCTSLLIVVLAQTSFSRPATWRWLQPEPETKTQALGHIENENRSQPVSNRRAPFPLLTTLAGAADHEPFLTPSPDALPEFQASAKARLDADARYQLLQLAKNALPQALESDARKDIRYQALLQKPEQWRGEIVYIEGDLISIGEPMELHRKVPGMDVCYLGLMTNARPEHQYLILFVDLPDKLRTRQAEWKQLYLRNIQFSGYFYKVAKFTDGSGKKRSWMLPVLVGKAPWIPSETASPSNWLNLMTVFMTMAIPVVFLVCLLPRYFKKGDKAHQDLMTRFHQKREERIRITLDELKTEEDRDLRFENERR